ncbi:hypothetical protein [Micrococcus luteus]|uniref:hypothetical protein n=1 Tax=Micrococcus luteus TaxID=1270 RepID=UPI002303DED5|nr:hypothetical protein [Micrococcus luteus]
MHNQAVTTAAFTAELASALPVESHADTDPAVWDHQVNIGPENVGMDGEEFPYIQLTDENNADEVAGTRFRWWFSHNAIGVNLGSDLDETATVGQVAAWAAPLIAKHYMP